MMKVMFEREAQGERVLDHDFLPNTRWAWRRCAKT
jgi:hypothetical protein